MILMTLSEIKEKISFEIVKLKQLILTSEIDYNKFLCYKKYSNQTAKDRRIANLSGYEKKSH